MLLLKMPYWYYDKKELRHSSSVNQGMPVELEIMYRREGARFILQVGNKMGLRYETMATGVVYFHRFYMVHTFQQFPRHVTACCCLFLAGKVEETPKKCKDIMKTARSFIDDDAIWADFGTDPREEVMTLERILLQTIKFDFIVEHPYTYLLKYAKCLKGDSKKIHSMVQMAWTFVNDSLFTTLCLQWEPEIIAIALMYLAGKLNKFEVTDWQGKSSKHQKWWDMFVQGISTELLDDICHQVLDLYSPHKAESSAAPVTEKSESVPAAPSVSSKPPDSSTKTQTSSSTGPPAKKMKKEESKAKEPSPAKTEATTVQSYQFPHPYNNFPPSYPPPLANPAVAAATPRYQYAYPQTSSQTQQPQAIATPHPPATATTYQPPPRYPSVPTTTATVHYAASAVPPVHYATAHLPQYPPTGSTPLYPPPATTTHPPSAPHHLSSVAPHHAVPHPASTVLPPSSHHPSVPVAAHHHAPATHHPPPNVAAHHPPPHHPPPSYPTPHSSSSTYYSSSVTGAPSGTYQQGPPTYGSSGSYMHSSTRSYYPPS